MPEEQHAKFIDPIDDFLIHQAEPRLLLESVSLQFMQRQNGIIARMIGVVAGGPVYHAAILAQGQIISDADRFVVRNEIALDRSSLRRPAPPTRAGTGPLQIDRGITAESVASGFRRHLFLMRAPTEF